MIVDINDNTKKTEETIVENNKKGSVDHVLELVKKNKEMQSRHKKILEQLKKINDEKKTLSVSKKELMEMLAKDPNKIFDEILHAYQVGYQDGLDSNNK